MQYAPMQLTDTMLYYLRLKSLNNSVWNEKIEGNELSKYIDGVSDISTKATKENKFHIQN